ncbi:S9 family peptidase [Saxibacter everestensis]|uniref:S9 family peptidase n=1 Tax=Saxibacter everestensis TaxID=2909229 RepID=A0ABY8QXT5_9MICO|nr:S9 family peptidase [Brevibacteriaceae bacterium ZFBP1038]
MRPNDIDQLVTVSAPAVLPGGKTAVYAASRAHSPDNAYVGQLFSLDLDGAGTVRQLTRGYRDANPVVSPDGSTLAFLRADKGGKPQLYAMPVHGGEPLRLTDAPLGAGEPTFAPDSGSIAYTARVPEEGRYGTDPDVSPGAEPPRHVTTRSYLSNDAGYVIDQRQQVFVVDVPLRDDSLPTAPAQLPESRQLTAGDYDASSPRFLADGQRIAFLAAAHDGRDEDRFSDVYTVGAHSDVSTFESREKPSLLTNTTLGISAFEPATDGTSLFLLAQDLGESGSDFVAQLTGLYRLDLNAGTVPERLTDTEASDLDPGTGIAELRDGTVLVGLTERGSVRLASFGSAGLTYLSEPGTVLGGLDVDEESGIIVASFSNESSAGEIGTVVDGELTAVTDFSASLRKNVPLRIPEEFEAKASDGYPVHGWVVLPEGEGPHPVLLTVHGGPFSQHSWALFDEAQVYARAGYAVLLPNPRGSAGYGREHGLAVKGNFGNLAMDDVLSFLDAALKEFPALDSGRLGVQGGSYGGYLTSWIVAHDHRFAGAIVERGYIDPESFIGTSDIGTFFGQEYVGADPEQMRSQSSYDMIDQVRTPTFVIHSERDFRCPLEQGQRYYMALKLRGIDTELLIFPGETHELSRSGQPQHRVARFEHILRWWNKHLPVG